MDEKRENQARRSLLFGESAFIQGRLARAMKAGGFKVEHKMDLSKKYDLAIVPLPGGPEVAMLHSLGVRLVAIKPKELTRETDEPGWPFEAMLREEMSAEEILCVCNEVIFSGLGVRSSKRYMVSMEVMVSGSRRSLKTSILNISEGGLFVLSLNPFPKDSEIMIRLKGKQAVGDIKGRVLYTIVFSDEYIVRADRPEHALVARPGMAVQFEEGQEMVVARWLRQAFLLSGTD